MKMSFGIEKSSISSYFIYNIVYTGQWQSTRKWLKNDIMLNKLFSSH